MVGRHLAQEIDGRVHEREFVAVHGEAVAGSVQAAQCNDGVEDVRAAEEEVAGMESTHGTTRYDEGLGLALAHLGDKFLGNVVIPALVLLYAPAVVGRAVAPRLAVYAVHADGAYLALFYPGCENVYHAEVLKVEVAAVLRGEDEDGASLLAVCLVLHLALEMIAEMFVVLSFHYIY